MPTYDSERWIAPLMAAGGLATIPCVFVDNGSSDGTVAAVRRLAPDAQVVQTGANLGYGAAANRGAAMAPGAHVLVLNPDVEVSAAAIARLLATLQARPELGAVAPRLLNPDGSTQFSAYRFPALRSFAAQLAGVGSLRREQPRDAELVAVDWAAGAILLVRRAAWDDAGGFDPAYFFFVEEVDLQRRLADAGWRTAIDQRAEATHHGGAKVIPAALFARSHDGWERYFGVHRGRAAQVLVRLLLCAIALTRAALWAAVGARRREGRAWARMFARVLGISLRRVPGSVRRVHAPYAP